MSKCPELKGWKLNMSEQTTVLMTSFPTGFPNIGSLEKQKHTPCLPRWQYTVALSLSGKSQENSIKYNCIMNKSIQHTKIEKSNKNQPVQW